MAYTVYGYYSPADIGHPSFIEEFESKEEADQCVKDFESISGRYAWIEEE
jgi:hypothetical protein